jgi:hypothetical protein
LLRYVRTRLVLGTEWRDGIGESVLTAMFHDEQEVNQGELVDSTRCHGLIHVVEVPTTFNG